MTARLRFAPAPTGYMHLGNARTAVFNYLLAKHFDGELLLRIEDTDQARYTDEGVDRILESLAFLHIKYIGPVFQSQHIVRHVEMANKLLANGYAYKDTDGVTRFKVKHPGLTAESTISFTDLNYGLMQAKLSTIEDFALLRSDGSPTYHLSVVVDDIDMGITHIVRGCDHHSNTFKQVLLYYALEATLPTFIHLPLIHDMNNKKLSKRDGDPSVRDFQRMGILWEALFNNLVRLGWGKGDHEFITYNDAMQLFDVRGISKSSAKFDIVKLQSLSGKYMARMPNTELLVRVRDFATHYNYNTHGWNWDRFALGLDSLKSRCKTLVDLLELGKVYLVNPYSLNTSAQVQSESCTAFQAWALKFAEEADWTGDLTIQLREFSLKHALSFQELTSWMRLKLSNMTISPSTMQMLQVLGKDEVITRIKM